MLLRADVLSVPELPSRSGSTTGTLAASIEFRSRRGKPVPPPCALGSGLTFTSSRSASAVTIDTAVICVVSVWTTGSADGTPTIDLGRNSPTRERVPFFMPRPILRIIIDAEEAVDEMDRLSVDPWKNLPPA